MTPDRDQTVLVIEVQRMPLDAIASFGAGWQIHAEARWGELLPAYQELATGIS